MAEEGRVLEMSDESKYRLAGFVAPRPQIRDMTFPCFVIPLYEFNGALWVQDSTTGDVISTFVVFRPDLATHENLLRDFLKRGIGVPFDSPVFMRGVYKGWPPRMYMQPSDPIGFPIQGEWAAEDVLISIDQPVRYAFVDHPWRVLYGSKGQLQQELRQLDIRHKLPPFIAAEVAEFIGDREWYKEAIDIAARVLATDNDEIAVNWREMMLSVGFVSDSAMEG